MPPQLSSDAAAPTGLPRSCWECQRRRRRCDYSRPQCSKCLAVKIVCPGYDAKKPLTWLTPGMVLSRPRRCRNLPPTTVVPEPEDISDNRAAQQQMEMAGLSIIPIFRWRDETTNILEAVYYYNSQIYLSLCPTLDLGPNPYIIKLLPEYLPYLSTTYQHCLACLVLSHRIHQLPQGTSSVLLKEKWLRIYHHRAIAIRSIREGVDTGNSNVTNKFTYDIFTLMCAELQFSAMAADWRLHYEGFIKVVTLRGGFEKFYRSEVMYGYGLLGFMIIGIMANTTSPASKQTAASTYFSSMSLISEINKDIIYPTLLCPHQLLIYIIQINYLRHQVARLTLSIEDGQATAMALAREISDFSTEEWVKPDAPLRELWLIAGQIYHSAVLLFCISSLRSLRLFPKTHQIRSIKSTHQERLFGLLPQAMNAPQLMPSMSWALVVAGMHVEGDNAEYRSYITAGLSRISHKFGIAFPLAAMAVLKKYWASGKEGWDDCFDQPYVFVW